MFELALVHLNQDREREVVADLRRRQALKAGREAVEASVSAAGRAVATSVSAAGRAVAPSSGRRPLAHRRAAQG